MSLCESHFQLPTLDFVGGSTQEFAFHTYFYGNGRPLSMTGCTAYFSVVSALNKTGQPLLSKTMRIMQSSTDSTDNILAVELVPSDTINLSGKYIYQVTIKGKDGGIDIPAHGCMYVSSNIDKQLIN